VKTRYPLVENNSFLHDLNPLVRYEETNVEGAGAVLNTNEIKVLDALFHYGRGTMSPRGGLYRVDVIKSWKSVKPVTDL